MVFGVILGGALGALLRYFVNVGFHYLFQNKLLFPWSTFSINIAGSLVLSYLFFGNYFGLPNAWRLAIGTGFLGAFTTFSTFELETLQLIERGQVVMACLYVVASVLIGFLAALLGRYLALR